jgi:hypothetical protein
VALRSVVLAPPPGAGAPRRTVVLRPGGPKDKGRAADLVTLVLGVLLLLGCVVLLQVLPNKEYALPQFAVTFPETQVNNTRPGEDFLENDEARRVHEFTYDLPANVFSVTLVVHFADEDLPASEPDQFRIELYDPAGNPVGARFDLFNAPPVFNGSNPLDPRFEPGAVVGPRITVPIGVHPEDQIVQGLSHREVAEQVLARLEPQHRVHSEGTWTVRVTLINAADCPSPQDADADRQQVVFCRAQPQPNDGQDLGNRFALENFIYTTYEVKVEELS